eukprot:1153202-Rhodomonas_salina.3
MLPAASPPPPSPSSSPSPPRTRPRCSAVAMWPWSAQGRRGLGAAGLDRVVVCGATPDLGVGVSDQGSQVKGLRSRVKGQGPGIAVGEARSAGCAMLSVVWRAGDGVRIRVHQGARRARAP